VCGCYTAARPGRHERHEEHEDELATKNTKKTFSEHRDQKKADLKLGLYDFAFSDTYRTPNLFLTSGPSVM
jgi:hypothetical protein